MTRPARFGNVQIFSMLFGVVYITCFYMDWSPFRYYPDKGTIHLRPYPPDGPAILWYGWVAAAAVVSAAIALLVPRRLADRVGASWAWVVALLTMIGILVYESRWFM